MSLSASLALLSAVVCVIRGGVALQLPSLPAASNQDDGVEIATGDQERKGASTGPSQRERSLDSWVRDVQSSLAHEKVLEAAGGRPRPGEAPICYTQREYGLGDRLRRLTIMATHAWSFGRDLKFDWGLCGRHVTFDLLFNTSIDLVVPGLGRLWPWTYAAPETKLLEDEACPKEKYKLDDIERLSATLAKRTRMSLQAPNCAKDLLRPEVVGLVAALQGALRPEWRAMAERTFRNAESGGFKVVGVHLRLGNGEQAFQDDGREVQLSDDEIMSGLEREAQRLAQQRGWGTRYRLLLATDTPRIAMAWVKRRPELVVTRDDGFFMRANQGILAPDDGEDDRSTCSDALGAAWADATALGLADVLLTPSWSELDLVPKTMVLARGGEWCLDGARFVADGPGFGTNFSCVSLPSLMRGVGFSGVQGFSSEEAWGSMPHLNAFCEELLATHRRSLGEGPEP